MWRFLTRWLARAEKVELPRLTTAQLDAQRELGRAHAAWCVALGNLQTDGLVPRSSPLHCEAWRQMVELYARAVLHESVAQSVDRTSTGLPAHVLAIVRAQGGEESVGLLVSEYRALR